MGSKVTVCLAVHNGSATLARAIDSVLAQTFRDFELLVLDDGSKDDSAEIARAKGANVLTVPNAGLGAGRKRMVEEATGEYIAFIDHDDLWLPEKLELQMAQLSETKAVMSHADCWYIYENGSKVERNLDISSDARSWDHILPDNRVIASSAVFHRQAMLDAGNFVADTVRCSDWYGWLILAKNNRFVHLPQKLVKYDVLSTSLANAGYRFHSAQHYLLSERIIPIQDELFEGLPDSAKRQYSVMLTRFDGIALSSMAKHCEKIGNRAEARQLHRQAIRKAPGVARVWTRALSSYLPGKSKV